MIDPLVNHQESDEQKMRQFGEQVAQRRSDKIARVICNAEPQWITTADSMYEQPFYLPVSKQCDAGVDRG